MLEGIARQREFGKPLVAGARAYSRYEVQGSSDNPASPSAHAVSLEIVLLWTLYVPAMSRIASPFCFRRRAPCC